MRTFWNGQFTASVCVLRRVATKVYLALFAFYWIEEGKIDPFCHFSLEHTEELGYQDFEETESSGLDEVGREMKKKRQGKKFRK